MEQDIHKKRMSKSQRLLRLIKSTLDPRAFAHGLKLLNYYNYTHVAELAKIQRGKVSNISPTVSFSNGQNIVLGERVRIGANCTIWAGNGTAKIHIDDDALLGPNVMITTSNYRFNEGAPVNDQAMTERDIYIGKDVWLAYGVVVLPGTHIGNGAVIGAGAVVRGHIEDNAIIVPAESRQIGTRSIQD